MLRTFIAPVREPRVGQVKEPARAEVTMPAEPWGENPPAMHDETAPKPGWIKVEKGRKQ